MTTTAGKQPQRTVNLRELVQTTLKQSSNADPGLVADEVLQQVKTAELRDALRQALRLFVRQVISETRIARQSGQPVTPIRQQPSAKVAAIREAWKRRLRDRIYVDGEEGWKFLADCTYENLIFAASQRRELADRNLAWAKQYTDWADLLRQHGVATFGQLPAAVLEQTLGRAA